MPLALFSLSDNQFVSKLDNGKFQNLETDYRTSFSNIADITKAYLTAKRVAPTPDKSLTVRKIPVEELVQDSKDVVYRLGHSSVLIRLDGEYLLTDPVFSDRASPVQWLGPKRFHPVPIDIQALPQIKAVIISHDHYDHLDKETILALSDKVDRFVVPLRVGNHLRTWGINASRITELDWWRQLELGSVTLTATPAQHFSGRGLLDRDRTLWASWVIQGQETSLFFSGDSGYFSGFKEIGKRFGPFDLTLIETGAYNPLWHQIHMLPEQSVQAHLDLRGKAMLPIHNATFDLSLHDWYEPLEAAHSLALKHKIKLLTPRFGERVSIRDPLPSYAWWQDQASADARLLAYE